VAGVVRWLYVGDDEGFVMREMVEETEACCLVYLFLSTAGLMLFSPCLFVDVA